MATVRLKELETGEEERNYSLILILSPSGKVARVAVFPHNWAILEKELREKIRSCGLRFFGLHL